MVACSPPITGAPSVTAKPGVGTAIVVEKALPDIRWQPVQWHAIVISGGCVIAKRTAPQRHPPVQGTSGRVMRDRLDARPHRHNMGW